MIFNEIFKRYSIKCCHFASKVLRYGCIYHVFKEHIGDFVICQGPSMEPTLYTNDTIVAEHFTPRFNEVKKGDIVIARSPNDPKQFICKRVAGIEGDIFYTGFINQTVVPRGHVWLEGDNRYNSSDSRSYGPVPIGLLRSRVLGIIWPISHAMFLTQHSL